MTSALEVASGVVVGGTPVAARATTQSPLAALEDAVLPALMRTPCLVTFSGGVDSSLVLAVATRVARRHGLADPLPFTWRVPDAPAADESAWQERVVRDLGLRDWVVQTATDELDLVGPDAARVLQRHGVRHPANLHLHLHPVELAAGGTLLTGAGGDQILSGWWRPTNRTPLRRLKNRVPVGLRIVVHRARGSVLPWLRGRIAAGVWAAHLAERTAEPVRLDERVRWHAGRRSLTLALSNLHRLAEPYGVTVVNPLTDPGFVAALAAYGGGRPAPTRAALVAAIAGDAVPAAVHERRGKARFLDVFFREPTRELVTGWDGRGVDENLVDIPALRRLWSSWPVPPGTAGLVQQVLVAEMSARPPVRSSP